MENTSLLADKYQASDCDNGTASPEKKRKLNDSNENSPNEVLNESTDPIDLAQNDEVGNSQLKDSLQSASLLFNPEIQFQNLNLNPFPRANTGWTSRQLSFQPHISCQIPQIPPPLPNQMSLKFEQSTRLHDPGTSLSMSCNKLLNDDRFTQLQEAFERLLGPVSDSSLTSMYNQAKTQFADLIKLMKSIRVLHDDHQRLRNDFMSSIFPCMHQAKLVEDNSSPLDLRVHHKRTDSRSSESENNTPPQASSSHIPTVDSQALSQFMSSLQNLPNFPQFPNELSYEIMNSNYYRYQHPFHHRYRDLRSPPRFCLYQNSNYSPTKSTKKQRHVGNYPPINNSTNEQASSHDNGQVAARKTNFRGTSEEENEVNPDFLPMEYNVSFEIL
ncbi:unnamed protein product [Rodentolepis nana]|uniref:KIX_2 domain-containing protein n=1 Tax=Rodentolepis nana TaxID=102285 RepID=A0A0R3TUU0_RODNA|nr:unnamed protein product [Rodentolepis nana]